MTTTESRPAAAPMIVEPYRAKDIQMAATIDVRSRTVLITGAIDSNDHDILVRVDLPSAGRWQVVKAETNLTDRTWRAWQITFSGGTTVVCDDRARNMCRQFDELFVSDDAERLCFYNGEIRPGEAVLKMFTVDAKASRIVMAHNRPTEEEEEEEIEFPIAPDEEEFRDRVRMGFPARAYIEAWLPTTVVE